VFNLEPSKEMLALGRRHTNSERAPWLIWYAVPLPFDEATFDLVASLEVLEFTPDPEATLQELIRVLLPGGWLIITNRVGWEAKWILGRTQPRDQFGAFLESAGLESVTVYPWQVDYDLAWARKPFITVL
jgi:SAM-dependent methyltransferase